MNYYAINLSITICSFIFYIFLLIIYFHKSANYSIKNIVFKRMILVGFVSFLFHFAFILLSCYSKNSFYIELSCKGMILSLLIQLLLWIYYVIILVFEKNSTVSSLIRQNHSKIDFILLLMIVSVSGIEIFLPITLSKNYSIIQMFSSAGVVFPYVIAILLTFIPIPCIIYQRCFSQKSLLSYYLIDILLILFAVVTWLYPMLVLGGFVITISYYLIYYRLENPDIVYLRRYYKDHERLRSMHEQYGFLFNMYPELRDLLNEISFMKDNYLVDEKKRISKKKLETLISDFVKSSEIGETKKTNIDDDGIEILDMEEDIPEEMLVTKEIYSLQELQEILKEDNLPKW